MRGNRKSDLLGDSASRRESRNSEAEQRREDNGALFEEEYRGSGRYDKGASARPAQNVPAGEAAAPVKKRRSYDEALAAASAGARMAPPPPPEPEEEDMFDPLPLRYHPQTEGFLPETRAERARLKGRAADEEPVTEQLPYEDDEAADYDRDDDRMLPATGRYQPAYEDEEEEDLPVPQPGRREPSYDRYADDRYGDDSYAPRMNERRRGRAQLPEENLGRSRRERELPAVPQGRAASGVVCPKCHTENPAGAKFCNGCGTNLQSLVPAPEGKREYKRRRTPEAEANYESRKQQVVAIYSPKGGVGKSTITKELAYMFANTTDKNGRDIKVIVVDVDLEMPDVSTLFRVLPRPNIADWVRDIEADKEAGRPLRYNQNEISSEYVVHVNPNLDLLCGTESVTESHMIKAEHIKTILSSLKQCDYDIIMLDCSNGISLKIQQPLMMADTVLWITTMDYTTLEETLRAFKTLNMKQFDMSKIKVILNSVPLKEREKQFNIADIEGYLGHPIVQGIPYDPNSRLANNTAEALVLGTPTAFTRAIRKIGNEFFPLPEEEKTGLFSRLFGKRKD